MMGISISSAALVRAARGLGDHRGVMRVSELDNSIWSSPR